MSYCIFEIHQLWQSGFSRVYSTSCCSCSFEPEIIRIGQSSHKMYSNNILNFPESTTILNACTKKSGNLLNAQLIYIYIYIYMEQATGSIGLYVNANITEYICFNRGTISTLNVGPQKLVDNFTYLGSSVTSTESDTHIRPVNAWTTIDRLSII